MGTATALAVDSDVVTCTLAPRYDAVKTARDFTRSTLLHWGLDDLFDDVALVASELVTNALRHAIGQPTPSDLAAASCPGGVMAGFPVQGGSGRSLESQHPEVRPNSEGRLPIRISLVHRAPQLVCAVSDPSSAGPVTREADFVAESGRGLHLVDSFSRSWGWHPLASGAGKVVWALFQADETSEGDSGLAPDALSAMTAGRHRRSA
ncbi:ATP-binding protein [Kitasatospora sp. NBC_01287]|uniref:ATP-binding protein n=1 Tax=Kitasatospora sp. NBC_01287 TaxID=2903573 RepID=UPI00225B8581|nr:ATP-binding protein [Kitasatospora sp. NBC_01287]MCX4750663.1 ATP-binding protein [Kitasatospora sp. NBC_01287]